MAAVLGAAALRLPFGVDLTDEAYYATFPHRFLLGDTPYVSDLNVRQNAGVLTVPLVWLWRLVAGSTDGMILVLRIGYFAARLALTALAVRALWNRLPRPLAILVGATIPAFVLFAIPTLSYNTIPAIGMSAGLLGLLLWGETQRSRHALTALAGAGLATFAHPAMLPVGAAIAGALPFTAPSDASRRTALRCVAAVALVVVIVLVALAVSLGAAGLARLLGAASTYAGPSASVERLVALPARLMELSGGRWLHVVLWLSLWCFPWLPAAARAASGAAFVFLTVLADVNLAMVWMTLGAVPLVATGELRRDRVVVLAVALSFSAGLVSALFSTNGALNMAVGAEVATLLFFVALWRWISVPWRWERFAPAAVALVASAFIARAAVWQWREVYRDDPVRALTTTVTSGPYRWMRTTPEKAAWIADVETALRRHAPGFGSLLVINRFPGGQIMAPLPPAVPHTWIAAPDHRPWLMRIREALAAELPKAPRPLLVLEVFRLPTTRAAGDRWEYPADDPLVGAISALGAQTLERHADFAILGAGMPSGPAR